MQKALCPSLLRYIFAQASKSSQSYSVSLSPSNDYVFQVQKNKGIAHTLKLSTLRLCQFKYESFMCRCGRTDCPLDYCAPRERVERTQGRPFHCCEGDRGETKLLPEVCLPALGAAEAASPLQAGPWQGQVPSHGCSISWQCQHLLQKQYWKREKAALTRILIHSLLLFLITCGPCLISHVHFHGDFQNPFTTRNFPSAQNITPSTS